VAGRIDGVGEGVPAERVGEPVMAMTRFGGYSSHICAPADLVVPVPKGVSTVEAASVPVVYLTAWMMLRVMGRVERGDRVMVHSAAGGVGLAALDLCRVAGAETWGSAGPAKHAFLAERGYDHLLDSRADAYPDVKMDLILDPRGGPSWTRGLDTLRAGGRLVCFGMSSMSDGDTRSFFSAAKALLSIPWLRMNPVALINDNKGVLGVNMGHLWDEADRPASWLRSIVELWQAGAIRPHVHEAVPFAEAARAHRILHDRQNIGKVVLVP
jgi:NADPH:quinone reductase-like Zn-dependent oxidoreductase